MKKILVFCFIVSLTIHFGFSQNYDFVDKKVSNYPNYTDIQTLSIRIKNDFETDKDRVRAIFIWIAKNIVYDTYSNPFETDGLEIFFTDYQKKRYLKKAEIKKLNNIMTNKIAVCDGYALLFKKLCQKINIESKIIYGYTKTNPKYIGVNRTYKDHAWNFVKIDNEWKIIDVTWASGYQDVFSKRFIKKFNDYYFFTDPRSFIKHHFPLNPNNQLVEKTISLDGFFSKPIFYPKYFNTDIKLSSKHSGIIEVERKNDFIIIHFDKINKQDDFHYLFMNNNYVKKLPIKNDKKGGFKAKIKYKESGNSNLTIFSNFEAILCFKTKLKNNLQLVKN